MEGDKPEGKTTTIQVKKRQIKVGRNKPSFEKKDERSSVYKGGKEPEKSQDKKRKKIVVGQSKPFSKEETDNEEPRGLGVNVENSEPNTEDSLKSLRQKVENQQNKWQVLRDQVHSLNKDIGSLSEALEHHTEESQKMVLQREEECEEWQRQITQLLKTLKEEEEMSKLLTFSLESKTLDIEDLTDTLKALEEKKIQYIQVKKDYKDLENKYKRYIRIIREKRQQLSNIENLLDNKEKELNKKNCINEDLGQKETIGCKQYNKEITKRLNNLRLQKRQKSKI